MTYYCSYNSVLIEVNIYIYMYVCVCVCVCAYMRDNVPHFKKAFLIKQPRATAKKQQRLPTETQLLHGRRLVYI